MTDQPEPVRATITPEAHAAVPAFVDMIRQASAELVKDSELMRRMTALADQLGLTHYQMTEAYMLANLRYAGELGGAEAVAEVHRTFAEVEARIREQVEIDPTEM